MQKHVNLVDLVKSFPTNIFLQNLASIQKRTSPMKFAHLAQKSGKGSIPNLSTKVQTLLISPWTLLWFFLMAKAFRGWSSTKASIASVLTEVVVFNPCMNFWYLAVAARPFELQWPDLELWRRLVAGYVTFWGPVELVCYRFVPLRGQVAFGSLAGFVWQLYLNWRTSRQRVSADGSPGPDGAAPTEGAADAAEPRKEVAESGRRPSAAAS